MHEFDNKPSKKIDLTTIANSDMAPAIDDKMLASFEKAGIALNNPAKMQQFTDIEEFIKDRNNFYMYFTNDKHDPAMGDYMIDIYFDNPANQRFRIKYPNLFNDLYLELKDYNPYTDDLSNQQYAKLYGAYKLMSKLIDKNDPGVIQNGEVKPRQLLC